MIQPHKIKIYRKALRYMNHEATSFYLKQQEDVTLSNSPNVSDAQQLEETIGETIKKKFHINEREKIIALVESVSDLNIEEGMERTRRRESKRRIILFPFLLLQRTKINRLMLLVYETNTTFAMLRQDGVPTNWGKQGLQDDIKTGDAIIEISPNKIYNFIQELPDIVFNRQLSTMKIIAELAAFKNSWASF